MTRVLLDTGPLIAAIDRQDRFHAWAVEQFALLKAPYYTCEAVIDEALYLSRRNSQGCDAILYFLENDFLKFPFQLQSHSKRVCNLIRKYENLPASLADASLICMSEIYNDSIILTLDTHFRTYRRNSNQSIPIRIPENR